MLGLAFKPHTDDLRDAPALDIARQLNDRGARLKLHDPIAQENAQRFYPDLGIYCTSVDQVFDEADAVVLVTEWPQYRDLPWEALAPTMRRPIVLDGRNHLEAERLIKAGYRYLGMGRTYASGVQTVVR